MFFGPPGTSKTYMAKAIAGELGWPLLSLSPSDFLARGVDNIEARAADIFSALRAGSKMVYFFDEIDEMIRERNQTGSEQRSAFSFLTPSFLTKLQDLRDAAKNNEFIFILATNYYENINSAAKRTGRVDRSFLVLYPDRKSRAGQLFNRLRKVCGKKGQDGGDPLKGVKDYLEKIEKGFKAIADDLKKTPPKPAPPQAGAEEKTHEELQQAADANASEKARPDRPPTSFADLCATFTGSLSYQTIQNFLKLELPEPVPKGQDLSVTSLAKELFLISQGNPFYSSRRSSSRLTPTGPTPCLRSRLSRGPIRKYLFPDFLDEKPPSTTHLVVDEIKKLKDASGTGQLQH